MATATRASKAAAKAAVNAVVDRLDLGTAETAAKFQIYSGTQPASPDAAPGTPEVLLAVVNLVPNTVGAIFDDAATGTGAETSYIIANADNLPLSDTSADATGTAAWFRAVDLDGVAIVDGTVGTADADAIIDNTSINAGQTVKLNSWKVRLPFK